MADQLDLFASPLPFPEGMRYAPEILTAEAEHRLLGEVAMLPFTEFEFHGHVGKRRTVSFGWAYDFSREQLRPAPEMPAFLLGLRETAAVFASMPAKLFTQVLVTEYDVNAGIGWHRDKAVFGEVLGVSLLSACRFRLRRKVGEKWERLTLDAAPRSAYLLSGPSRTEWEHSIPAVDARRYSITYRAFASSGPQRSVGPA